MDSAGVGGSRLLEIGVMSKRSFLNLPSREKGYAGTIAHIRVDCVIVMFKVFGIGQASP